MTSETKGITVKIDAKLHAQVREYVESHGMTMAEFVSLALYNELHPKYQMQEELDLILLEFVVYTLQLKSYGIEDADIQRSINELFCRRLAL